MLALSRVPWRLFVTLALLAGLGRPPDRGGGAQAAESTERIVRDLRYVPDGAPLQTLDLYRPADAQGAPVVIWVHGGGWRRGDKAAVHVKPQALNRRGYALVSVNYRLAPAASVEQMAGDVAAAVAWVAEHAAAHGLDRDRLVLAGHSAGAHLAALVATDPQYLAAHGLGLSDLKGCVPVDTAMYDVVTQLKSLGERRRRLHAVFGTGLDQQRRRSPLHHVVSDAAIPPFLILHVADRWDSAARSTVFAKALNDAGGQARAVGVAGKTHATINRQLGQPGEAMTKALFAFLSRL